MNRNKDIWNENNWKTTTIVATTIILTILLSSMVNAIPLPKGIDGTVYELDGLTQISEPVNIQLKNLDTQELIMGKTGRGTPARYSAALSWDLGVQVQITASNGYNQVSRTVILEGSMHNVDLALNTSYPALPPEIISEPIILATENEVYAYLVVAKDLNKDQLRFSLLQAPQGMIINNETGLITWTPNKDQVGSNTVIVEVTDGQFSDQQTFSITVEDVNNAPIIISEPKTSAQTYSLYYYWVQVDDEENNYEVEVLEGPSGMIEFQSVILWRPTVRQVGTHHVLLQVKDSYGEIAIQEYNVTVTHRSRGGSSGRTNDLSINVNSGSENLDIDEFELNSALDNEYGVIEETITAKDLFEFSNNLPIRIVQKVVDKEIDDEEKFINSLKEDTLTITATNKLQNSIITLNTFVYSYVTMSSQNEKTDYEITFAIDSKWLTDRTINKDDVILYAFSEGKWISLQTKVIAETQRNTNWNSNEEYFIAKINKEQISNNKLQWYAISHDLNKEFTLPKPSSNNIKEPFSFYGFIQSEGRNVNPNLVEIEFVNKENKERYSASIFSTPDGTTGYQTTLHGNAGDEVEIYLKSKKDQLIKEISLEDNLIREDLTLKKIRSLNGVTGYVVGDFAYVDPLSLVAFFILIIFIGGLFIYHHKLHVSLEKEKKKEEKK